MTDRRGGSHDPRTNDNERHDMSEPMSDERQAAAASGADMERRMVEHYPSVELQRLEALARAERAEDALARVKTWAEDVNAAYWYDTDYREAQRHALDAIEGRTDAR